MDQYSLRPPPRIGTSAILAVLASLGSMFLSCSGRPLWGLILAVLSIPLGLIGFIRAASPEIKGGIASILSIIVGIVGVAVAVVAMFFKIVLFHW
ncbi:MAG TPA: hypothetical protein VGQ99_04475 [Tepidisphaeraceae bacterium]|jgi:hypothetical protein|nr:hypothetical protein [Tepidisphaeraceae bacterium]